MGFTELNSLIIESIIHIKNKSGQPCGLPYKTEARFD